MRFDTLKVRDVSSLNKTEIVKRLQAAVRESQGGKRASWARQHRPSWWKEGDIELEAGEVCQSLKFESKSKANWDTQKARVTLLLYLHREGLEKEEARNVEEGTTAKPETSSQGDDDSVRNAVGELAEGDKRAYEAKVIVIEDDEEGVTVSKPKNSRKTKKTAASRRKLTVVKSNEEVSARNESHAQVVPAPTHPASAVPSSKTTGKRKRRGRQGTVVALKGEEKVEKKVEQRVDCVDVDMEDSSNDPSPSVSHPPTAKDKSSKQGPKHGRGLSEETGETQLDDANDGDGKLDNQDCEMTNVNGSQQGDEDDCTVSQETPEELEARRQKLIQQKKAELRTRFRKDLKQIDLMAETDREKIVHQLGVEIDAVQNAHMVIRLHLSKEVCNTPLVQYINECNADSREWLLKVVAGCATRAHENGDSVNPLTPSVPEPHRARREEVLRTTRKVARAAREREMETGTSKVPATLARARPRRTAAKTALKKNQEIFRQHVGDVQRVRTTELKSGRVEDEGLEGMKTPEQQVGMKSEMAAREKFLSLLRTQKNPQRFVEECLAAFKEEQKEGV